MKVATMLLMIGSSVLLASCATQPTTDYSLSANEMKNAGSATMNQQESVPSLYSNAEFVK